MPEFKVPLRDMRFVLHEVFDAPAMWARLPALTDSIDTDTADAILEEAAKVTSHLIAPLNRSGDEEGAQWHEGRVTTPIGFKQAYATYIEGGWVGLSGNPGFGGMGMPKMLAVQFEEMLYGANSSFALYSALSSGACLALDAHASDALKNLYLPPMYEGRWSGSMCLTEAHAGTDLGLIRTRAEPQADGSSKEYPADHGFIKVEPTPEQSKEQQERNCPWGQHDAQQSAEDGAVMPAAPQAQPHAGPTQAVIIRNHQDHPSAEHQDPGLQQGPWPRGLDQVVRKNQQQVQCDQGPGRPAKECCQREALAVDND